MRMACARFSIAQDNPLPDLVTRELIRHAKLTVRNAVHCHFRDSVLKRIRAYVSGEDLSNRPLVLHGTTGVGKTAVMAKAAAEARRDVESGAIVAVRYCGTTASASQLDRMLRSLVHQMKTFFTLKKVPKDPEEPRCDMRSDLDTMVKAFHFWLHRATHIHPIVMFLDRCCYFYSIFTQCLLLSYSIFTQCLLLSYSIFTQCSLLCS
jgi:hypothetical protein